MAALVHAVATPVRTDLHPFICESHFFDSWQLVLPATEQQPAMFYLLKMLGNSPAWVDSLMTLRNKAVQLVGLKDLSVMSAISLEKAPSDYQIGDRVGIFTLISQTPSEVIVGDNDKHLEVRISFLKEMKNEQMVLTITTAVKNHNWLGRCYMWFVKPFHRVIAPATLKRLILTS
ncbi:DUF2867 domain-containing protein [Leeia sp. TBRC 13508]|uniref:DUF2867 domain-containing protein n=1 Tax=Leeia speluncae TaxID=2884804 RepID=A0ABS8D805_9NEIS|nr:DUF2867 domain-containing protein [Leeia speluncae]MCB6184328.1 DUF2867 domain-containing protein [Leeia speluncae]